MPYSKAILTLFLTACLIPAISWSRIHVTSIISLINSPPELRIQLSSPPQCKHGYITKNQQQDSEITLNAVNDDNSWAGSECTVLIKILAYNRAVGSCFYKWDDPYAGHTSIAAISLPHPFNQTGTIQCTGKIQQGGNNSVIRINIKYEPPQKGAEL